MDNAAQKPPVAPLYASLLPSRATREAVVTFLATGAYTGYAPVAPGSCGSIVGLLLARFALAPLWRHSPAAFVLIFIGLFALSCGIAGSAERLLGEHDSSRIVLDEVFGMIATMFMNPTGWSWLIAGFALFRLFDIIKPWPAVRFDRMQGGAGVMLDDLVSAIYANVSLQVLRRIL